MFTIVGVLGIIANVIIMLVIVQFVLSLLVAFNVVSHRNEFVVTVLRSLNALLEPLLAPIRRILPDTGMIDFSPMALLILIKIVMFILTDVALRTGV